MNKTMACAFCGKTKVWPYAFVSTTSAQCLTCWLRDNPRQVEPMRAALAEFDDMVAREPDASSRVELIKRAKKIKPRRVWRRAHA